MAVVTAQVAEAVEPGHFLASTGAACELLDVDPADGAGTFLFELCDFGPVTELVFAADGTLFGTTGGGTSNLITIDPETGEEALIDDHPFGAVNGLALVEETLYGTFFAPMPSGTGGGPPTFLVVVNPETADLTPIGEVGYSPVRGLAYDPASDVLYGVAPGFLDQEFFDSLLLTIDRDTGEGTVVGPVGHAVGALRFGPGGLLYGGTVTQAGPQLTGEVALGEPSGGGLLITIDTATGAGTEIGSTGFTGLSGLAYVPEVDLVPDDLEVDSEVLGSNGNGVFEPGEQVGVAPAWRNDGDGTLSIVLGTASNLTGPAGPTYTVVGSDADYGVIDAGETSSCLDGTVCYSMEVGPAGVERPAVHWDAAFDEALSDSESTTKTWALHMGDSFSDVPQSSPFYRFIETVLHYDVYETLLRVGLTAGCIGAEFCPTAVNTRAEMSVFLLKALEGPGSPPACTEGEEVFSDVPFDHPVCPWIEELERRGVTAGCGGGDFCPDSPITRAQMAVLLLRALEGEGYAPMECTGEYTDVMCPSLFADWIEDLADRGITSGCQTSPAEYCPAESVTRQQMAVFVTRTFGLELYGP